MLWAALLKIAGAIIPQPFELLLGGSNMYFLVELYGYFDVFVRSTKN